MNAILSLLRLMLEGQRRAFLRGALLAITVLAMGGLLLGLSGWFITAAAAAGLAGAGTVFDVFRPSASVRFLAIARTAARYGERLFTHDATLRTLTSLRVALLGALTRAPLERLTRLRAGDAANRLGADIDALDGITLRLAVPLLAGVTVLLGAFGLLWWLVDLAVAAWVVLGLGFGALAIALLGARLARTPSREAENAAQGFRAGLIALIGARTDLAVAGRLARVAQDVAAADSQRRRQSRRLDRRERGIGAALALLGAAATAGALALGGSLAQAGTITPALAALGVFAALALFETVAPARRAAGDFGRMAQAARRVRTLMAPAPETTGSAPCPADVTLVFEQVSFARHDGAAPVLQDFSLRLEPGARVALAGASGSGKSTVLLLAAGFLRPDSGRVTLGGIALESLDESARLATIALVPQRAGLLQASIAENLRLAAPGADDAALWAALKTVHLDHVVAAKGGLEAPLGPRGAGLSGGEARRLVLARAVLRAPRILLLDEPTEGLDEPTAEAVLADIAAALPGATILLAAHRNQEMHFAQDTVRLRETVAPA